MALLGLAVVIYLLIKSLLPKVDCAFAEHYRQTGRTITIDDLVKHNRPDSGTILYLPQVGLYMWLPIPPQSIELDAKDFWKDSAILIEPGSQLRPVGRVLRQEWPKAFVLRAYMPVTHE